MSYYSNMRVMNSLTRQVYMHNHVGRLDSFPEEIILTPTLQCNFRCVTCTQDHSDLREYPEHFLQELEAILPFVKFVNITGGEPLLYRHFDQLISMITDKECSYWLVTNGSLLNPQLNAKLVNSPLQTIKFSVDGGTAEAYAKIRVVGNFYKILKNIAGFMDVKVRDNRHDLITQFNFVALRDNIESLPKLVALAADLGINQVNVVYCVCATPYLAERSLYFHQQLSDEKMLLADAIGKKLGVTVALPRLFSAEQPEGESWLNTKACDFPFKFMAVEMDGRIGTCCGTSIRRGDIFANGFSATWNDPLWVKLRETVNTENELEMCKNCTLCKQNPEAIAGHIPDPALAREMIALHGGAPISPEPQPQPGARA